MNTPVTSWQLVTLGLRRDPWRNLGLSCAVAVGVGTASLVLAIQAGAQASLARWIPAADRSLTVEAPRISLGGLAAHLDAAAIERLRTLPGVQQVVPRMGLRVPALSRYNGAFFGQRLDLAVEVAAEGVDADALTQSLPAGESFVWKSGETLPACISQGLLDIYNATFAPARGLPALDGQLLRGFEFPLTVGASMVGPLSGATESVTVRLVCVAPDALLAGLTVPLQAVQELNRRHGKEATDFSSATIVAANPSVLPSIEGAVARLGLRLDDTAQVTGRRLSRVIRLVSIGLLSLAVTMLSLAAALVAQVFAASAQARAGERRLLRALGATRGWVIRQGMVEALVIGGLGATIGLLGAAGCGLYAPVLLTETGLSPAAPMLRFTLAALVFPGVLGMAAPCLGAAVALWGRAD